MYECKMLRCLIDQEIRKTLQQIPEGFKDYVFY